ncbi:RimJ/RimL family protein N-acetyltransferase [Krasilnikovia cinnamomea]|uniref:RimJ/RimL family protein N-acetyltransferase n=1 Tax=Krasilnikovia cinnamomea TaxID=349313 RepID=A0A4Q7ZNX5_9ACTN|nr:GNAT family N-acetyltransferase [Krasilnikovia cinnamomea]RZU52203.1 RimJ/RimL family protein N-acetyltransferase [Krasilnikovia cinnamomea]
MIVPTIEGDGVRLRIYRPDDLDAVVAGYADPLTQRFMPSLPAPFERQHGEFFLREAVPEAFALGGCAYAITDPATDRVLGGVGLERVVAARRQAELGYWVSPGARGRGVATAAVRALTDHAFAAGVARLEVLTHWENAASQRVALATGFRREGVRRGAVPRRDGDRDDLLAYGRLAGDPPGPTPRLLPDLPGGELTDGVVTLRPLTGDDIAFYTELHTVPDVVATIVPPVPPDAEEIRRRCAWAAAHWLNGDRADLVVVDTASGLPAGNLGLFYQEPVTGQAMIGYSMLPAFRGRGYQTRAVQLLALWAFAETGIARLVAGTLPDNAGSQRVLEKAGFRREAFLRSRLPGANGLRSDDVQFALLAEDLVREAAGFDR